MAQTFSNISSKKKKKEIVKKNTSKVLVKKISSEVEREILNIEKENNNILNKLSILENQHIAVLKSKSDALRQLAKNYERLSELGVYKEPISHICSTIREILRTRNLGATEDLAWKALDSKYKQEQFTNYTSEASSIYNNQQQDSNIIIDPPVTPATVTGDLENDSRFFESFKEPTPQQQHQFLLKKPVTQMTPEELKEATESLLAVEKVTRERERELKRRKREMLEKCEQKQIRLSAEWTKKDDHISTQTDDSGPSVAYYKVLEFAELLEKVAEKMFKFKPSKEMAEKIAYAMDEEMEFWKPMADEKFRKDTISWLITEMDNLWNGKHAAAMLNDTLVDEKTRRTLTREQVGDKWEPVIHQALRLQTAFKYKLEMHKWYMEEMEKPIAKRAIDLHPKLAEYSFT